jgi:hypothetical protein
MSVFASTPAVCLPILHLLKDEKDYQIYLIRRAWSEDKNSG